MKELTFREVMANIKEGEVWESENNACDVRIIKIKNGIQIRDFNGNRLVFFSDDWKFTQKRKEYTFEEAFKMFERGKIIKSISSENKYKRDGIEEYFQYNANKDWIRAIAEFTSMEIRNKWYIEG